MRDAERTPRLPDADRFWLATGAQYTYQKNWKFDVGFAYEFVQRRFDQPERRRARHSTALINGNYDVSAWLLGGQVAYSF